MKLVWWFLAAFSLASIAGMACSRKSTPPNATVVAGSTSATSGGCDDPNPSDPNQTSDESTPVLAYTAVAPDGYSVWTVRADGAQRRKIAGNAIQASWSPDGHTMVTQEPNPSGALVVTNVDSGNQRRLDVHLQQSSQSDLTWDPSGERFAYSRLRPGDDTYRDLWISDISGNAKIALEYADPIAWSPDGRWIAYRAESHPSDRSSFSPPPQLPDGPTPGTLGGALRLLDVVSGTIKQVAGDAWIPYGFGMQIWSADSHDW